MLDTLMKEDVGYEVGTGQSESDALFVMRSKLYTIAADVAHLVAVEMRSSATLDRLDRRAEAVKACLSCPKNVARPLARLHGEILLNLCETKISSSKLRKFNYTHLPLTFVFLSFLFFSCRRRI